ncbi:MAG: ABC transporter ATP-binding protein [Candidatus Hodarchaeota archaeon]
MTAIEVTNLTRRYGYRTALKDLTFTTPPSGVLGLFGANGAGKTTLMRVLATLLRPHSGTVRIFGMDPEEHPEQVRRKLGLIGDKPLLYSELTGRENLQFYGKLYGLSSTESEKRIQDLATRFGVKSWLDEPVKNLSTGLKKRFDIARTYLHEPELLLLDEPFAGLDKEATEVFEDFLSERKKTTTALLTTHNLPLGEKVCDHFLTLRKARLFAQGPISEFDGSM